MGKYAYVLMLAVSVLFAACSTTGTGRHAPPSSRDTYLEAQLDNLGRTISAGLARQKNARLAVIDFTDLNGSSSGLGKYIAEELTTRLVRAGSFQVSERRLIESILREQQLSMTGLVDEKTAVKVGSLLGADFLATGTTADLGSSIKINARIISVEQGAVFSVASVDIPKSDQVNMLLRGNNARSDMAASADAERLVSLGTSLFDAAENGQTERVRDLVRQGADVDVRGIAGRNTPYPTKEWTPLLIASHKGYARIAEILMQNGADVHAQNYGTRTALHLAAEKGHVEIVKLLIAKGADVNKASSHDQWTPLHMASYNGQSSAALVLLDANADPSLRNIQGATPLDYATAKGLTAVVNAMKALQRQPSSSAR